LGDLTNLGMIRRLRKLIYLEATMIFQRSLHSQGFLFKKELRNLEVQYPAYKVILS
jgi:hypothetical protein